MIIMNKNYQNQIDVQAKTPYAPFIELVCGAVFSVLCAYLLRSILITGATTLQHDNFNWGLPIFHFFAEAIINGHYPLWNPLSHGGEPFYPLIVSIRLLEPAALLTVYIGQFITHDTVLLFNWTRFIQTLIMAFGAYIVLRPLAVHIIIRLSLMPILLFSSFTLSSFQQDGILYQFVWVPYIAYFLLRIVYYKDSRWHNWLMLAAVTGLNWQSYFFAGAWLFISIFLAGILIFRKDLLKELLRSKMVGTKIVSSAVILFFMCAPNIVLMTSKDEFIYPPRMMSRDYAGIYAPQGMPPYGQDSKILKLDQISGIRMPYSYINMTGTFSTIWNFIQIISPEGNPYLHGNPYLRGFGRGGWGRPSEAYMYIGLLPWAMALLGIVAGRHDLKKVWLLILASFGLLMLGPPGGLHRMLYYVFPPLWMVRHMHMFALFFIFAFLYFYILGSNHIFLALHKDKVFDADMTRGFLGGLFKNARLCKALAFLIFSITMTVSVWVMTKMAYPATDYLFVFIALIAAVGWFLRKDLGASGLYAGLTVGSMAIYLIFSTDNRRFGTMFILFLCLPLLFFHLVKSRRIKIKTPYLPLVMGCILILAVSAELIYGFSKTSFLYGEAHPSKTFKVKTIVEKESPSLYRVPYLITTYDYGLLPKHTVVPGYLPFMYRQSFVFSPTPQPKDNPFSTFEYALNTSQMSTPFFLKKYAELINMDSEPVILEEMFAVGKSLFQFKKGFVKVRDADLPSFLKGLGVDNSLKLLRDSIIIDGDLRSLPSNGLMMPPGEWSNGNSGRGADQGNFTYNFKNYSYNSFDMLLSSGEPGFLYWADGYDGNWRAYVNEVEAPIYRANVNFKAVEITHGINRVRFVYDNRPFMISLLIFYITFITCILVSLLLFVVNRSRNYKSRPFATQSLPLRS